MNHRDSLMTPAFSTTALPSPRPLSEHSGRLTIQRVLQWRLEAVLIRHAAVAEKAILQARREVAEAALRAEEAEAERELRRTVRAVPAPQGRQILDQDKEVERLLLEREQLRRQRLGSPSAASPLPALPSATTPLDWEITDEQVEALALRAVARFAPLPRAQAERAWAGWQREAHLRLPPYAATELIRRADALRGLIRR